MLRALQNHSAPFRWILAHRAGKNGFQLSARYGARRLWHEAPESVAHVPEDKRELSIGRPALNCSETSSPLDTYLRELAMAGIVNNPERPYDLSSVGERLTMLRERERRWKYLDWISRTRLATPAITSSPTCVHGGVVYLNNEDAKEDIIGLHSASLPSNATNDVKWTEINLGKTILISTLAIEHDLLVCLTSCAQ